MKALCKTIAILMVPLVLLILGCVIGCGESFSSPSWMKLSLITTTLQGIRMLFNGCLTDATDEYSRPGQSITLENVTRFCAVIEVTYRHVYLEKNLKF